MKPSNIHQDTPPTDFSWEDMQGDIWEKVEQKQRRKRRPVLIIWLIFIAASIVSWQLTELWVIPTDRTVGVEKNNSVFMESSKMNDCEQPMLSPKSAIEKQSFPKHSKHVAVNDIRNFEASPILPKQQIDLLVSPIVKLGKPISLAALSSSPLALLNPSASDSFMPSEFDADWVSEQRILWSVGINSFILGIQPLAEDVLDRNNFEAAQVGLQLGFDFQQQIQKKIYWGAGATYVQLHSRFERYSERPTTLTRDVYITPWSFLLPRDLLEETWQGEIEVHAIEKRNIIHHNLHHLIETKLYLGYQLPLKRFTPYVHTGFSINVLHNANGKTANASGETIVLEESDYFKSNTGMSWILHSGLRYKCNKKITLFGEVGRVQSFSNWISLTESVVQKPSIYHFSIGAVQAW